MDQVSPATRTPIITRPQSPSDGHRRGRLRRSGSRRPKNDESKKDKIKPYDKVVTKEAKSDPGLFLVHRIDDVHLAQALVGQLLGVQRVRDHADHVAALAEHGVGEHAHQPDAPAAVDQRYALLSERRSQVACHGSEFRPRSVV